MIEIFAKHRVAANLLMIMMVMAGLWAVRMMPSMLDPPANFPSVFVEISWIGAAAEDIETLVTTPIEQQLRTVNGLKELTSRTVNGYTFIRIDFNYDADMTLALDEVKQRVTNIRNLPVEIEPPMIRRPFDQEPVSVLLVTGEGALSELTALVRSFEEQLMSRGIEGVYYDGLAREEIALLVGGKSLQALGLTLDEVAQQVSRVSQNVPAGSVGRGQGSRQLRSLDQRRTPLAFEQLQIESNGQLIRLMNFAGVVRRPQHGQPILTSGGKAAIEMVLWRNTAADAYVADKIVKDWLDEVRPGLPEGVEVREIANVWRLIDAQLDMILKNGLSGLVLVILVLYLFLSGRTGYWVTVGIPVSFLLGLAIFYTVFGYGISVIALIGFIMALGIVVDDAIVVGEDIVTHFENGATPQTAAIAGARQMWAPVFTSSLTTMAAFLPLLILGGVLGQLILALPTVLLCVIAASLVECFWVLPNHLRTSLENSAGKPKPDWRVQFDRRFFQFRDHQFLPLVRRALNSPVNTLLMAMSGIVVALSLVMSQHVGLNLVLGFAIESLEANVEFSSSATDQQKLDFVAHLESTLAASEEEVAGTNILGWTAKYNRASFDSDRLSGEQYASIAAQYAFEEDRTIAPAEMVQNWREKIERPAYVEKLTVAVDGGANGGEPDLTLILRGKDAASLKAGADALSNVLRSYPGVSNVTDNLPYGKEQIIFTITPRGKALGLTTEIIGAQLRGAYSGARVQIFNEQDSELEVRVMLPDAERDSLGSLRKFPIRTAGGEFLPLANVADLTTRRGIDVIRHFGTELSVTVSADVDQDVNNTVAVLNDVENNKIQAILDQHDLTFGLGGHTQQDQILLDTMALGGLLTLVLIYLILAWVFSSFVWPLAIMLAIPFGLTGAIVGHWLTGWDIGAMSLLAFFSLSGIVINDSIVLVSFLRRDVDAGIPVKEALLQAVRARFRAVILTSLTTVAGLAPLMFETSSLAMYVAPIAVTVCFGLSLGTALVLIVIPALILLLEDAKGKLLVLRRNLVLRVAQ